MCRATHGDWNDDTKQLMEHRNGQMSGKIMDVWMSSLWSDVASHMWTLRLAVSHNWTRVQVNLWHVVNFCNFGMLHGMPNSIMAAMKS